MLAVVVVVVVMVVVVMIMIIENTMSLIRVISTCICAKCSQKDD